MCDFSEYGTPSPEWLALEATLPPQPSVPLEERVRTTNAVREAASAAAMKPLQPWVKTQDHTITTRDGYPLEARTYRPSPETIPSSPETERLPVYIHLHGGGFLFGTLSSEDAACARIAINARIVVLNVNYRHTPEWVYPTAWNDVEDAFAWLHENIDALRGDKDKVVVGGISAGAYLGASLALGKHLGRSTQPKVDELPPIKGLVLTIPALVNLNCYGPVMAQLKSPEVSSWETCKDAPILPRGVCEFFMGLLKVQGFDEGDVRMNPGLATAGQVKGLPPTVFGVAGFDPLRDEGLLFAKRLAEAGVPTDVHVFKGLPHGFRRYGEQLSECQRWDRIVENGIVWALSGPDATGVLEIKTE